MTTRTTVRSWPAMGLAGVFLAGTSFVLFNDIIFDGVKPTTGHVLTALALIAATAAGHLIVTTFRARRYFNGIGMVLLTAAALAYVATMSGARNAEQATFRAERIDGSNAERERIAKLREQAQVMLNVALKDVAAKCKGGVGGNCKGATATRDVYEAAVKGHNADLAKLPAQQTPNAGYKAAAEALAMTGMTARSQADVEKALIVLLPWLAVLIAELGTIVFLSSALGHREVVTLADSRQTSFAGPPTAETTSLLASDNSDPAPPGGSKRGKRLRLPANVLAPRSLPPNAVPITGKGPVSLAGKHPVIAALELAGKPLTNSELAHAMEVCGGESTKRRREVADLIDEWTVGKFVFVGLKTWRQVCA